MEKVELRGELQSIISSDTVILRQSIEVTLILK